jgi:hypothetical protein
MRRLVLTFCVVASASAAFAFDPTPVRGNRIGILATMAADDDPVTLHVAAAMRRYLSRELRRQGFEAFDVRATFDEVVETDRADADYYIEFITGYASDHPYGGVGVGGRRGGVDLGLVGSYMGADLRLYDAQTMAIIDDISVEGRDRAVVPTAIGIGGRNVGVWVGLPVRFFRHRAVAKEAAKDAAESIAGILETEAARD